MRKPVLALTLAATFALPAVAGEEPSRFDTPAPQWTAVPLQSPWRDAPVTDDRSDERPALRPLRIAGEGWAALDGWMRGDPMLRHWVMYRFDLDADGGLAADEAALARRAFYAVADANRSGVISREEFVSGWSSARRELRSVYAVADVDA